MPHVSLLTDSESSQPHPHKAAAPATADGRPHARGQVVTPNGSGIDLDQLRCGCGQQLSEFDTRVDDAGAITIICPNCQNSALVEYGAFARALPPRASRFLNSR
jgi:hypothetical protein